MRRAARAGVAIGAASGVAIAIWLVATGGGKGSRASLRDVVTGRAEARAEAREREQIGRQQAELREQKDRADRRRAALPQMLGARPGQPGPLLDGVHFDFDAPVPADARARIDAFTDATDAHVYIFANSFPGVSIDFDDDAGVVDAIVRAWGPQQGASGGWTDEPDRVHANLYDDHGRASLSWQAFQTVDDLIAPRDPDRFGFETSFALIGASADRARDLAHAGDLVSDRSLMISLRRLTPAMIIVDLEITFERAEVVAYRIHIEQPDANDAVLAALAAKLGPPAIDGAGTHDWIHHGLRIRATPQRDGLVIDVAGLPK